MSEKLDALFEKFKNVFVAREQEIKNYLLKYKKDDFKNRDVIDIRRRDASERLKTSGFRKNLSMWQNFYENIIVSSCIEIEGEQKRYDYKFYFTEEKIDSELLEQIDEIIKDINKLKARTKFEEALEKVDIIKNLVKEKEDEYFNEHLKIIRKEIKDAKNHYNESLEEIDNLKNEIKDFREREEFEKALEKNKKIIELAKSIRKRKVQKQYESINEDLRKEKIQKEIGELEQKVRVNTESGRYNVAIDNCEKIIELAESSDDNDIKKQYQKEIGELEAQLENLKQDKGITDKISALEKELKNQTKESNYREALEIVVEIIQLASFLKDEEIWDKYTNLKDKIIFELEEEKRIKMEKEIEEKLKELEDTIQAKKNDNDFKAIIEIAEKIIPLASDLDNKDKIEEYHSLIKDTKIRLREKKRQERFKEDLKELESKLKKNRDSENWEKALKNCRDIIYLAEKYQNEKLFTKYTELKEELKDKVIKKKKASALTKKYEFNWEYNATEPILSCSVLKKNDEMYFAYGGHNRAINLLDNKANLLSSNEFDGWVRCSFPIDSSGDEEDEVLVGTGDGDMLILKFKEDKDELVGIFHSKIEGKILCCTAGDINLNGIIDFVYGGEGKKVLIFEGIKSKKPQHILYYASWVTALTIGPLKLPDSKKPGNFLLVGTQDGLLQLIQLDNDELEILWQKNLGDKINDISLGDVFNSGYNEICVACDDSSVKILDSSGELKKTIEMPEGRPLTLNIDDIDDDKAQEVIVGGSHGTLSIFQNEQIDSTEIELKWKTTGKTSIQTICTVYNSQTGTKEIIYAGYDKTIKNITDFDWGKKRALEIPDGKRLKFPPLEPIQEQEVVNTNLKEVILNLFNEKLYLNLNALINDVIDFGYSKEFINEITEKMKDNGSLIKQKTDKPIWILNNDNLDIKIGQGTEMTEATEEELEKSEEIVKKEEEKPGKVSKKEPKAELRDVIIEFIKKNQPIDSKSDMVGEIVKLGYKESKVNDTIDLLNDENIITYSRSTPQGWKLVS